MRTTSPGCGAIGVRFVITTVTGKGAGPEAGELVDGSGGCVVAGVGGGAGARLGWCGRVSPGSGTGSVSRRPRAEAPRAPAPLPPRPAAAGAGCELAGRSSRVGEQIGDALDQASLVGVGEPARKLTERYPRHLLDLDVVGGKLAVGRHQQEVVNRLVDAPTIRNEPEVDRSELGEDTPGDAGFLGDLAHRGVLRRLARLDVSLRKRPEQAPTAVGASDERGARLVRVVAVDAHAAAGGLLHRPHTSPRRGGHGSIVVSSPVSAA